MGVSRWRHGPELGSLETMPDRVNLETPLTVDGAPARPAPWWARGWPRLAGPRHAWLPWSPRCLGCGEAGAVGRDLCAACDTALPRIRHACPRCGLPPHRTGAEAAARPGDSPCDACRRSPPPLTRVVAPFLYAPPLDRWLPRFKFHRDMAAGRLLAQLMLEACAAAPRPDALVPVPLHRARLRSRGYDQALELAKPLAHALALPLRTGLLRRTRATAAQSSLHAGERSRNLAGAFAIAPHPRDRALPAHVVLVDDVMTTGATLHAAATALLDAGVARVDAWTCARTP
jgi:ComF family protein